MKYLHFFSNSFPIWIVSFSILCLFSPGMIDWYPNSWISPSLGGIMLSMGLALRFSDFKRVLQIPLPVFLGIFLQFTIMPVSGFLLSTGFLKDQPFLAAGLILVASCPGGTASNLLTYLARADLALSVTMTVLSTFLSIFLTPFLSSLLIGDRVEVNFMGLLLSTLEVVLLPVLLGILLSQLEKTSVKSKGFFSSPLRIIQKWIQILVILGPSISVILITLIVAKVIANSSVVILDAGIYISSIVFLLHASGFFFGHFLSFQLTRNVQTSRTVSIEVGMQNSGLGVVLANMNFANPLVAVPPAISSLMHSVLASILAFYWRKKG
ncbi:MAG: bile acid:sodium symporter family protein [Leptospiraceae bacterium]|nr:bile acid:sodium symporter family protein [Leptospiraceae bacterium]MCP5510845.1 bile acid:sodium symporter family protein [Leptospiraceae bacterium]